MSTQPTKEVRYFLFSQQLADGIRITAAVVLPAFLFYQAGLIPIGFAISLGAMSVSMTDAPGPVLHRRNGMLITAVIAFVVALATAYVRTNVYLLGLEIGLFTFLFSLFQVYGLRGTSVGSAAILIMVLTMGRTGAIHPLPYSLYIFGGGLWYTSIALFFYYIRPYRPAQRMLGDCIRALADYLSTKALFYDIHTDLHEDYKKLVAQQAVVNEKQDAVREFFFKTARIVTERTRTGKKLVATFVQTIDLFEDITATYYNYSTLRKRFEHSDILQAIATLTIQLAVELDSIGIAVQSNRKYTPLFSFDEALIGLKKRIDAVQKKEHEENTLILKKILVNIRRIAQRIREISSYFDEQKTFSKSHVDHTRFITHQPLHPRLLWDNLGMGSTAFKHALRISAACLVGFAISKLLAYGQHSYWILLTIAFILKPAFSLTKTRNVERIIGTITGGVIGVLLLYLIKNTTAHFVLMVLLMAGAYTFLRTRYLVMVICTTAYILILFQFLDIPFITVVQERIFDTVLGCVIAFSAGYFLFPDWEAQHIRKYMAGVLLADAAYLQKVVDRLEGTTADKLGYKLARKQVYVQSANLSAAYQRMAAEPKSRQHQLQLTHQFLVRNHLLFSNIAHVAALVDEQSKERYSGTAALAKKAVGKLYGLSKKLDATIQIPDTYREGGEQLTETQLLSSAEDNLIKTSVEAIAMFCDDMGKTAEVILAA